MSTPEWCPDWVRIARDHRVSYYTGAAKGEGRRLQKRHRTREAAEAFARQLIAQAERSAGLRVAVGTTWADLCQAWVDAHEGRLAEATLRRRLSAINAWILPHAGETLCADSSLSTLLKVADQAADGLGRSGFDSVVQTMHVVATWGRERGYLPADPLGADGDRRAAVRRVRARVPNRVDQAREDSGDEAGITIDAVPTWEDVCALADAVADRSGGAAKSRSLGERHGAAVRVAAGTGLRLCELLGLTADELDLESGVVVVRHQLDRYTAWEPGAPMPTAAPKHHRQGRPYRRALIWDKVRSDLELLTEAADGGPLVPRHEGTRWWADAWGRLLANAAKDASWRWPAHWLRHHYGSVSYTPREHGGYGLPAPVVQQAMGHAQLSTFLDVYAHPTAEASGWVS